MKENKFLTYMNLLDDTYIEEADPSTAAPIVSKTRRTKAFRRLPVLVAATVALMALLVVGSFATFNDWGSYLSLKFKGDVELLDDYTVAAKDVKYTSTNEDVKLEIVGYTGDQNYAYVWVKMTLPQEFVEQFSDEDVDVLGFTRYDFQYFCGKFAGGELHGNIYTFGLPVSADEINDEHLITVFGSKLELCIQDLTVYLKGGSYQTIQGKWTAKFKIELPDLSKKFTPDTKDIVMRISEDTDDRESLGTAYADKQLMWELHPQTCHVILSPMSVRLTVTYDNPNNLCFDAPRTIKVILSDGAVITSTALTYTTSHAPRDNPTDRKEIIAPFDTAINPDDVVAIEYAGARIELR